MALPDDNKQVRQLARAVTAGELTRDAYRHQRRQLIDRYAGEKSLVGEQFSASTATIPDLPVVRAPAVPAPAVPNSAAAGTLASAADLSADDAVIDDGLGSHGRHDLWIGILAAMAVVLGAAGLVLLMFFR